MGLGFLKKLFGGDEPPPRRVLSSGDTESQNSEPGTQNPEPRQVRFPKRLRKSYVPAHYANLKFVDVKAYDFPRPGTDARVGERPERLARYGLPSLTTPDDLAKWLNLPLKTVAWLSNYHGRNQREEIAKKQHYHYTWAPKKRGGWRLIEAPKPLLRLVQKRILAEILNKVPAHPAAHGFVAERSIVTNAAQHAGKFTIVKGDLQDFYPSVSFRRVRAVFRGLGYNFEIAEWLARLCTNRIPAGLALPDERPWMSWLLRKPYRQNHLPQGAPTSPALANLAAWALDVRLSGVAKKFGVTYTRYADDLTFSGGEELLRGKSMTMLIRYVRGIVRDERYRWNFLKKKVVCRGRRQIVTGLTVNEKPNVPRKTFDLLKATLHNCAKHGPDGQNRSGAGNFRAHLEGRISFVRSVNPQKAERLQRVFNRISW